MRSMRAVGHGWARSGVNAYSFQHGDLLGSEERNLLWRRHIVRSVYVYSDSRHKIRVATAACLGVRETSKGNLPRARAREIYSII